MVCESPRKTVCESRKKHTFEKVTESGRYRQASIYTSNPSPCKNGSLGGVFLSNGSQAN